MQLLCLPATGLHLEAACAPVTIDLVSEQRSRGSTGRSRERPEGLPEKYKAVHQANIFAERLAHICLVAHAMGVYFAIEQPASSDSRMKMFCGAYCPAIAAPSTEVLWYLPCMRRVLRYTKAVRVSFAMCTYGTPTIKPTVYLG